MEESFRFTGRATSASAAARRNAERVDSLRGNLTSPSNMSDSSDSEDGKSGFFSSCLFINGDCSTSFISSSILSNSPGFQQPVSVQYQGMNSLVTDKKLTESFA
jgi:hypothetical protein